MARSASKEIITPIEFEEVVAAQQLPDIDYERRMTFGGLIARTAASLEIPADFATTTDLKRARPFELQKGLYIRPGDPRYEHAELRVKDVILPSQEFPWIARSPADLARQTMAGVRKKRRSDPDRDETEHAAHRAAGHVLENKLETLGGMTRSLEHRRQVLASLLYDLGGTWPHYKAKNLEARREEVDQAIHETAEVAAVNLEWDNVAVRGLHRAIKTHLYRKDTNPAHRIARWQGYMVMVDRHTQAKMQVAAGSLKVTTKEYEKYKPYLEDVLFRDVQDLA